MKADTELSNEMRKLKEPSKNDNMSQESLGIHQSYKANYAFYV